jgi:predicted RNase H-like HicB family nuclease
MRKMKIVYWQEKDGVWLGHFERYPDYITQADTLDELKENLKDILKELESGEIPIVKVHEEIAV